MTTTDKPQYRAEFDADVSFSNGGGLHAQGLRVDVPGPEVSAEQVAALFTASLGLLMTERVELKRLRVFPEPHRAQPTAHGTRGGPSDRTAAPPSGSGRLVDLSHRIDQDFVDEISVGLDEQE